MLFSALFSPQRIKSKIRFLRGGGKVAAPKGKGILVRIGTRAAEGQLASTPTAGRLAACLPLSGKSRKIDGLLVLRKTLPLAGTLSAEPSSAAPGAADLQEGGSAARGQEPGAAPGEILYWTEKQVIIINTRRTPHPLERGSRFVPLGRLRGSWRSALARTPSGSRVTIEPWP